MILPVIVVRSVTSAVAVVSVVVVVVDRKLI